MTDPSEELAYASVAELRGLLDSRHASAEEVVRASIDRIERLDGALGAVVAVRAERAIEEARAADRVAEVDRGPLHGIPFSVKDVTETLDLPTTYGSVAFRDHRTDFEAAIVTQLRRAGAILVCKTATPELACEPVTRSALHGVTRNPWAPDRTPGGSSGGAAAGLAAGLFTLAQGTDAGGSIRIPASCCGVVGIKPTRGLVSLEPGRARDLGRVPAQRAARADGARRRRDARRDGRPMAAGPRAGRPPRIAVHGRLRRAAAAAARRVLDRRSRRGRSTRRSPRASPTRSMSCARWVAS